MRLRAITLGVFVALGSLVAPFGAPSSFAADPGKRIPLPGGEGGIGLDDMGYASALGRIVVPAGRTGTIDLIDPKSGEISRVSGFRSSSPGKGHGEGTTSADEGDGYLFASDRTALELAVVAEKPLGVVSRAKLAGSPDYVRWVESTNEIWVTEPDSEKIEVFRLRADSPPVAEHAAAIAVPGGPESLLIDNARGRAYANLWKNQTVAIDLKSRAVVARWPNGCGGSRGLALDRRRGFLFVACTEGKVATIDVESGKTVSSAAAPAGIDIIDYNATLAHLYVPGAKDARMAILAVSKDGALAELGRVATAPRAHCVVSEPGGTVYVCDPEGGAVIEFRDPYPGENP